MEARGPGLRRAAAGGVSLAEGYPRALALKQKLLRSLAEIERGEAGAGAQQAAAVECREAGAAVAALEQQLWRAEAGDDASAAGPRELALWRRRLAALRADVDAAQGAVQARLAPGFRAHSGGRATERRRLLGAARGGGDGRAAAAVEAFASERERLEEGSRLLDTILAQGQAAVAGLAAQNSILKSARRQLRSFGLSLGASVGVVGTAERRHRVDRLIVYACMLFNLCLFLVLYWFVKAMRARHHEVPLAGSVSPVLS